jgi:hypothetical protein
MMEGVANGCERVSRVLVFAVTLFAAAFCCSCEDKPETLGTAADGSAFVAAAGATKGVRSN